MTPLDELVLKRRTSLDLHITTVPYGILASVAVCAESNSVVRVPVAKSSDIANHEYIVAWGSGLVDSPVELHGGGVGAGGRDAGDWNGEAGRADGCAAVALGVLLVLDFLRVDFTGVG